MYYEQRMRARNVSKFALAPLPDPTLADSLATVYHQRWIIGPGREILGVDVLARDAAHAVVLGEMVLAASGLDGPFFLDVNIGCPDASVDVKGRILRTEPKAVFEDRQRRFNERVALRTTSAR